MWVYCGGGFRAAIAASLLSAAGVRVTLIDQPFAAAVDAGLTVSDTPVGPHHDQAKERTDKEIL